MRHGRWFDRFLPARCILCAASCPGPMDLCPPCRRELPWLPPGCARCGLPLPAGPAPSCGACLAHPPRFGGCTAALAYAFPVRELLLRFKQGGDRAAGRVLGMLLAEHIAIKPAAAPPGAVLLPMPLHPRRLAQRGFNQAACIAEELRQATALRCAPQIARRSKSGRDQKQLGAAERRTNLRGAFDAARIPGFTVIIVDDVMTTGATADALADVLLRAGAAEVHVWCVARAL